MNRPTDRQYPGSDQLDAGVATRVSLEQQRHADYVVMSNRLFVGNLVLSTALLVMVGRDVLFHANFAPSVQYVQFEGGKPVVFKPDSAVVMDSLQYNPYRLRQVVSDFLRYRYAYDARNLPLVLESLRLMTTAGREAEVAKIRTLDLNANVAQRNLKVTLQADESAMKVVAEGKGRFRVTVPASLALLYQDGGPESGRVLDRRVTFDLTVVSVRESVAPLGYLIDATGENRVW